MRVDLTPEEVRLLAGLVRDYRGTEIVQAGELGNTPDPDLLRICDGILLKLVGHRKKREG